MRLFLSTVLLLASAAANAASIPFLDFPLKNGASRDEVYKMSEHADGVFVFEAYRISCGYCNENAPVVNALATEYAGNPRVQVLDLGLDTTDSEYAEWIARHEPNHPVIQDVGRRVYNSLKTANGIPQVFVVNCKGVMVGNHVGTWDDGGRAVRGYIAKALETTCK